MYNNFGPPYNPQGYNPYSIPQYNPNTMNPTISTSVVNTNKIFVTGIDGARNHPLSANSDYMLLDNDKDILYQKIVDGKGQFEVKMFDIVPHKEEPIPIVDTSKYVSKEDFDTLQTELKQVQKQLSDLGELYESIKKQPYVIDGESNDRNVTVSQ